VGKGEREDYASWHIRTPFGILQRSGKKVDEINIKLKKTTEMCMGKR
jgi:hypothetical protein